MYQGCCLRKITMSPKVPIHEIFQEFPAVKLILKKWTSCTSLSSRPWAKVRSRQLTSRIQCTNQKIYFASLKMRTLRRHKGLKFSVWLGGWVGKSQNGKQYPELPFQVHDPRGVWTYFAPLGKMKKKTILTGDFQSAWHRVNLSLLKQKGKSYTCYTGIACLSIFRHMATNRKSSGAIFAWFICNFITPCHRHIINNPVKYNNARIKITLITCFLLHVSGWGLM